MLVHNVFAKDAGPMRFGCVVVVETSLNGVLQTFETLCGRVRNWIKQLFELFCFVCVRTSFVYGKLDKVKSMLQRTHHNSHVRIFSFLTKVKVAILIIHVRSYKAMLISLWKKCVLRHGCVKLDVFMENDDFFEFLKSRYEKLRKFKSFGCWNKCITTSKTRSRFVLFFVP